MRRGGPGRESRAESSQFSCPFGSDIATFRAVLQRRKGTSDAPYPPKGPAPFLVPGPARRPAGGRARPLHAAGARPSCSGATRRARLRPPSTAAAIAPRSSRRVSARTGASRAVIMAGNTTARGACVRIPQHKDPGAGAEIPHRRLPHGRTLRLCLGRAGRADVRRARDSRGGRSFVPPHPRILRAVERGRLPRDGELVRQRAFQLRPPIELRRSDPTPSR